MKKLFFLLMAFSLTLSVAIANDVGKLRTDMQISYVVDQPSPMPVMNAVMLEASPLEFATSYTILQAKQTTKPLTVKLDAWRNPDWGGSLAIMSNSNTFNYRADYTIRKIPLPTYCGNMYFRNSCSFNVDFSYSLRN